MHCSTRICIDICRLVKVLYPCDALHSIQLDEFLSLCISFSCTISFASFGYCLEVMALWLIFRVISSSGFIICPRMPGYLYACWFQHQTLPRYQDVLTVLIPYMLVARSYSQCLASSIRHAYYLRSKTHTPSCHLSRLAIRVVWNVACLPTINLLDVCICIYHSVHPWSQSHSLINIIPPYHTYCVYTVYYISRRGVGQAVFTSIWCLIIPSLSFWLHP